MNRALIDSVRRNSSLAGEAYLVLLAIAAEADDDGGFSLAPMPSTLAARIDTATFQRAVRAIVAAGEARADRRGMLWLAAAAPPPPATAPINAEVPDGFPQNLVGRVMLAAGIQIDPMQPFYWHRAGHLDDAGRLLQAAGGDEDTLLRRLRRRQVTQQPRRLLALLEAARG